MPNTFEQLKYPVAWGDVKSFDDTDDNFIDINLIDSDRKDILTLIASAAAKQMQFPVNTAFLHGMGVIASVMNKSFKYDYYDSELPVNLYVVTSQPPSTGKSGINGCFVDPARIAFADFNNKQKIKISAINKRIYATQKELKKATTDPEVDALYTELATLEERIEDTPIYSYGKDNCTPESLEMTAFSQKGKWTIISDEAGAINVLLGNIYGDSDKGGNNDLVLKSWDGGHYSVGRVGRGSNEGNVVGSISVIAQDETITTLLNAGARGNGISERFLLLREPDMLGKRDHTNYQPMDRSLKARYAQLINELVFADDTVFSFSKEATDLIISNKQKIEPHMSDSGKYSSSLLRGVVGKMDKQVTKMASVLHVVEHWKDGEKPTKINGETIAWAIKLYKELIKLYIDAADSNGFVGDKAEMEAVKEQLVKFLKKERQVITISELRDHIKSKQAYKGRTKLSKYIKENVLIRCIDLNLCTIVENKIVINPKLR
jgi:hypothetical protein